jgi:hypothetical protein
MVQFSLAGVDVESHFENKLTDCQYWLFLQLFDGLNSILRYISIEILFIPVLGNMSQLVFSI